MTNSAGAPAYTEVRASGAFNSWSQSSILTNDGTGIYTNTFDVTANGNYKYTCVLADGGTTWEDGSDHGITLTGSPQTLPLLAFNNGGRVPIDFVTNDITFQVDMQVQGVSFINAGGYVSVSGGFNGWGNSAQLTNDPALPFPQDYIYKNTFTIAYQKAYLTWPTASQYIHAYKFRANGGWEEPAVNPLFGNNDRRLSGLLPGPADTLPLVFYSDASLCDVLAQDTTVTFRLHLTNGTVATDGTIYDKNTMGVYMNGESLLGFWETWGNTAALPLLTNNPPGSDYYEYTQLIPAGRPVNQKVKYSINGPDNEAPQYSDHVQWIRTTNTTYVMAPVEFGTNYASARVQQQWGNLAVGTSSGGNVPVDWLGCPCVILQSRSSLSTGSWSDVGTTDAASSHSAPANEAQQYYRLRKRSTP